MYVFVRKLINISNTLNELQSRVDAMSDNEKNKYSFTGKRIMSRQFEILNDAIFEIEALASEDFLKSALFMSTISNIKQGMNMSKTSIDKIVTDKDGDSTNNYIALSDAVFVCLTITSYIDKICDYINYGISGAKYLYSTEYSLMYNCSVELLNFGYKALINNNKISRDYNLLISYDNYRKESGSLELLADINDRSKIYALSHAHQVQYEERALLEKVAIGNMTNNIISNDVFDIVTFAPECTLEARMDVNAKIINTELMSIKRVYNYLIPEGVLILGIPIYKLNMDFNNYIAAYFDVLSVMRHNEKNQLCIILKKNTHKSSAEDIAATLSQINVIKNTFNEIPRIDNEEDIKLINKQLTNKITISGIEPRTVRMFKGTIADTMMFIVALGKSTAAVEALEEYRALNNYKTNSQPILPLSTGQTGLALASGEINGVIEEPTGEQHLIKGVVHKEEVKKITFAYSTDISYSDTVTEEETVTNTVDINILCGNGTYKEIGMKDIIPGIKKPVIEEIGVPLKGRPRIVKDKSDNNAQERTIA